MVDKVVYCVCNNIPDDEIINPKILFIEGFQTLHCYKQIQTQAKNNYFTLDKNGLQDWEGAFHDNLSG